MLAERLDHLLATVHPRGRGPYSIREVVAEINAQAGEQVISRGYLSQLRTGQRTEPSAKILLALSKFFGVPVTYFTSETPDEAADEQIEIARALRDNQVRTVALRASGLSEKSLKSILMMIEQARELERLGDDSPAPLAGKGGSHGAEDNSG